MKPFLSVSAESVEGFIEGLFRVELMRGFLCSWQRVGFVAGL